MCCINRQIFHLESHIVLETPKKFYANIVYKVVLDVWITADNSHPMSHRQKRVLRILEAKCP